MSQPHADDPKKRKKAFYSNFSGKKNRGKQLQAGLRGFLITCNNNEVFCVREAYNLLNEYGDILYGKRAAIGDSTGDLEADDAKRAKVEDDIEAALLEEVKQLKETPHRFKQVTTQCKNIIFIEASSEVDPMRLMTELLKDMEETKKQKARFLLRMIPVSSSCKASKECIEKAVEDMLVNEPHEEMTFMIQCKVRNNTGAKKPELIDAAAAVVQRMRPKWSVNLDSAKVTVNVDVVNTVCCLSLLKDYNHYNKYNILEFARKVSKIEAEKKAEDASQAAAALPLSDPLPKDETTE